MRTRFNQNLLLAAVIAVGMLSGCGKPGDTTVTVSEPTPAAINATNLSASVAPSKPAFEPLKGKWLRPDGGYILEIRSVDDKTGKLEASYSNPRPINVAKAEASREVSTLKVLVELRAPNYPGSTYTLEHDPATDQLKGIYYQAAIQQKFEVVFERTK